MARRQETDDGFAILNMDGGLWTNQRFSYEGAARQYISDMQRRNPSWSLSKHTIVPAKFTVKWNTLKARPDPNMKARK